MYPRGGGRQIVARAKQHAASGTCGAPAGLVAATVSAAAELNADELRLGAGHVNSNYTP
jgi:hypothetical protein